MSAEFELAVVGLLIYIAWSMHDLVKLVKVEIEAGNDRHRKEARDSPRNGDMAAPAIDVLQEVPDLRGVERGGEQKARSRGE